MGNYDPFANETLGEFLERTPDYSKIDANPLVAWNKDLNRRRSELADNSSSRSVYQSASAPIQAQTTLVVGVPQPAKTLSLDEILRSVNAQSGGTASNEPKKKESWFMRLFG